MNAISKYILDAAKSDDLRRYVTDLLLEICAIDTTPYADVTRMRDAESEVFDIIERELQKLDFPSARRERRPVNPAIADHPAFSQLHFTKTEARPEGLPPEDVYAERGNLLYFVPGKDGREGPDGVAVNAHIDVVKPYIPPRLEDGIVYGRGSCDDKGAIVSMLAAFRLLSEALVQTDSQLSRNLLGMFVIEEETGGNGSLSLAIDRELKKLYDSILVLECTGNNVHPANRGAVWYRADLTCEGVNLFEMFAFVIEQLEQEGRAIKAESRHPLFPQRPVQTCHGMIGSYGEHPSRICGEVSFNIDLGGTPDADVTTLVTDCIEFALEEYIAVYGDKTKATDPTTGQPKVDHHYDLVATDNGFRCDVHGSTGHMGSILENGAITKMAAFVRALFRSKAKIAAAAQATVTLSLTGNEDVTTLKLEGGQGFVPTHDITEVMDRVKRAVQHGAETYLRLVGRTENGTDVSDVTYDKLHNAAFDGDPDSETMQNAVAAARDAGIWQDQDITGWTVSCDSRLFASEYPDMSVITSGAGYLQYAHGDEEQIRLDELVASVAFVALFIARQAGVETA
jgi:acetylornithine deacetylase/succinyl-diaminopimelate desuccinylase-like protein